MGTRRRVIVAGVLILSAAAIYLFTRLYRILYYPVTTREEIIYISTGSGLNDVERVLLQAGVVKPDDGFIRIARWKNYDRHIYPGKYRIPVSMSINEIINLLRSGRQEPVELIIGNLRKKEQLADLVASHLETDSSTLINLLEDDDFLKRYGHNSENVMALFLPNRYQFNWNTSAENFFERMLSEYKKFWNKERQAKAKAINMSEIEITILASIVQLETTISSEMPIIAGVYINRLKKGIPLQADPTVIYAIGDFSIKRLLNGHLKFISPYNTYINRGLPPGPICLPNGKTIDKTLNYERHNYLFFCAKEDFSGGHYFSSTLEEHSLYATRYRKAMNASALKH